MADAWDPAAFGLVPVGQQAAPAASSPSWDPAQFGLTPVQSTSAPAAPAAAPTQAPSTWDTVKRGVALGTRDVLEGAVGPLYNAAATPLRAVGLPVNTFAENLDALGMPRPETGGEKFASSVVQPVAGILPAYATGTLLQGAASPVSQAVGNALTSNVGTQVQAAGLGGAVENVTGSPTAGLITSLAVPGVRALADAVPPILGRADPARAPLIATAQREGIDLTPRQITGGRVAANIEAVLADLPGASGVQARVNQGQQEAWNQAAMARTGTASDTALPQDLAASRANIGHTYNDLTARNTLRADPQFATELRDVAAGVNRYIAESDRGPLNARIEDVVNGLENGTMPGRTYQNMYSALGDDIRSTSDGKARNYLTQLRNSLRDAMDRSISPADQQAWQAVRGQHGALQTVQSAMNRPSETTAVGNIPFAGFAQASNNGPTKGFANASGNMNDLARLGQIMKQTVPSSGTSQRNLMTAILTGGALSGAGTAMALGVNPLSAIALPAMGVSLPWLAAQAYHSTGLRNALLNNAALTPAQSALLTGVVGTENQLGRLRDR